MSDAGLRVFMIAGEASGDALGAALIEALRTLSPGPLTLAGVGGPALAQMGLMSLFPMDELSVMGLAEVLPQARHLLRRVRECADAVLTQRPDVLITIDSPDFCLRVAKRVRAVWPDVKVVHYVAPSVWAWRPGRAVKMARVVDHVLALLPFEPPYMRDAGMSCDFVGHPVVAKNMPGPDQIAAFRNSLGLEPDQKIVTLLPGSRRGEITRLAPVFVESFVLLRERIPGLAAIIPAAPGMADLVRSNFQSEAVHVLVPDEGESQNTEARKFCAFAVSDAALAASGTVSLELAATQTPMVIAYATHPITAWIVRRLVRIDTVTLVNLVSQTNAVPEYLQEECRADLLADALYNLLTDDDMRLAQQLAARKTMAHLGQGGRPPGERAAQSVLDFLRQ